LNSFYGLKTNQLKDILQYHSIAKDLILKLLLASHAQRFQDINHP